MSAGWEVGDLALCVDAGVSRVLVGGGVYTVTGVAVASDEWRDAGTLGIFLKEVRSDYGDGGFKASRFRKIKPDEREACEPEFVTLLNRIKQGVPS